MVASVEFSFFSKVLVVFFESEGIVFIIDLKFIIVLLVNDLFEMVVIVPENVEFNISFIFSQIEYVDTLEGFLNRWNLLIRLVSNVGYISFVVSYGRCHLGHLTQPVL